MEVATKIVDTELMETLYGVPVQQLVAKNGNPYIKIGAKKEWPKDIPFKDEFDSIMMFFNAENGSLTLTYQIATSFHPYEKKSEMTKILFGNWEKEGKAKRSEKRYIKFRKGYWALKYKLTKTGKFQVIRMDYGKRKRYPVIWSKTACWEGETKKRIQELVSGIVFWGHGDVNRKYNPALHQFLMRTIEQHVAKLKEKANGTQKPVLAIA